jgi:hypothetical protein
VAASTRTSYSLHRGFIVTSPRATMLRSTRSTEEIHGAQRRQTIADRLCAGPPPVAGAPACSYPSSVAKCRQRVDGPKVCA